MWRKSNAEQVIVGKPAVPDEKERIDFSDTLEEL
jgi:hypothetical protein